MSEPAPPTHGTDTPSDDVATVRQRYATRLVALENEGRALDRRDAELARARGFSFLAFAGFALVGLVKRHPALGVGAALAFAVFGVLVVRHARVASLQFELGRRLDLVRRGLSRVEGRYRAPESEAHRRGESYREAGHPYEGDLDVLGAGSLFELLDVTHTPGGSARLARWLLHPADANVVALRQRAARELAKRAEFLESFALAGMRAARTSRPADHAGVLAWAKGTPVAIPVAACLGLLVVQLTLAAASASLGGGMTRAWGVAVLTQIVVVAVLRPRIEAVLGPVASRQAPLGGYPAMMALVEAASLEAEALAAPAKALREEGGAAAALAELDGRIGFAAVRHNALVAVVANVFLMWDLWSAARLEAWRRRHGSALAGWLDALSELEALAALGTFAAEHPDFCWPVVTAGTRGRFRASALGHPLVAPGTRVTNDVALEDVRALMITGSNMSGKSTMLRSIGVAAVLAQAGAPVCAAELAMTEARVWTSMRIDDSLADGASHFFAEVRRLKAVVDAVRTAGTPVLFLLDEVLHGTNSRERILGAKAVVRHLVDQGGLGAVSSHDLGLVVLEDETGGCVRNVHFQEQVADGTMGFDYRMRPGPVATSNALRLMRQVGIDVVPEDVEHASLATIESGDDTA